ncbi:MAG TPA: ABC transporter ATP-binding protein [Paenalcaligenes sp.]|nr:ABC transporter ATP-binding protein [Paenalcaligenes sp.]
MSPLKTDISQSIDLVANGLSLGYGDKIIIDNLEAHFPPQKVTAIIGPNGCGKSTLLAGVCRVLKPISGRVTINGQCIHSMPTRRVAQLLALLPQEAHAPQGLTVEELVRFGRQPHQGLWQRWRPEDEQIVQQAIQLASLQELAQRPLDFMSGGQRQRAWIAMTIAQSTPLLLLDEPTSALDMGHQIEVFELIRQLAHQGKTIIMVVHDLVSACRFADHIVAMKDGQILAAGAPEQIITADLIKALYGVHCKVIKDPYNGTIMLGDVQSAYRRQKNLNVA